MNRVDVILHHPSFVEALKRTTELEKDRVFCGHGMDHLIDVARIAYTLSLETCLGAEKETIYAAALLHDLGRPRQYEDGTPHEQESARIAASILPECGYGESDTAMILDAILSHRTRNGEKQGFAGLIYRADKLSRRCFDCTARDDCDWEMKNARLEY